MLISKKSINMPKNDPQTLVSIKDLTKTYGKKENIFKALRGITLDISKGDSLAIIGKSGSGKSTLMHILACLDKPTSGTFLFEGKNLNKLKTRELDTLRNERFGFVFQQFFMNANDTVLDNVALPLKIAGVGMRERRRHALEILKQVDLADKAKNRARDLSGGQKQRVCIARALITKPDVIFADEPTGNLDSVTGAQVEEILFNLNKELGITLIIVTHDDDLAKKCKRQIYIKDGKIQKEGK
jgi:putative ABC transport system ATP-binding protein